MKLVWTLNKSQIVSLWSSNSFSPFLFSLLYFVRTFFFSFCVFLCHLFPLLLFSLNWKWETVISSSVVRTKPARERWSYCISQKKVNRCHCVCVYKWVCECVIKLVYVCVRERECVYLCVCCLSVLIIILDSSEQKRQRAT